MPAQKIGGKNIWQYLNKNIIKDQERYEGGEEDERRLLYVAITRSQKFLFISRAPDGRNEKQESLFCKEVNRSDYVFSDKNISYSDRLKKEPIPKANSQNMLLNFSVLKNYFDCPYRFKLICMYGFCFPLSIRMGYGRSLHNVLMEIHKKSLDGVIIREEDIRNLIDTHVYLPYAYDKVITDSKGKAQDVVEEYVKLNKNDFKNIEFAEKDIQIDFGDGIIVNGRIDLIKKKQLDGTYQTTIVDFKSAEDVQTYDISMEQLSLYALGYKELSGEKADFLEIYNLDKNSPEKRAIKENDLMDTKNLIITAAHKIRGNKLEKKVSKCESCRQNKLCSKTIN